MYCLHPLVFTVFLVSRGHGISSYIQQKLRIKDHLAQPHRLRGLTHNLSLHKETMSSVIIEFLAHHWISWSVFQDMKVMLPGRNKKTLVFIAESDTAIIFWIHLLSTVKNGRVRVFMNQCCFVLCHSWHMQTCGFIQQLCNLRMCQSWFPNLPCSSLSVIFQANTKTKQPQLVMLFVCACRLLTLLVNRVEFTRPGSQ